MGGCCSPWFTWKILMVGLLAVAILFSFFNKKDPSRDIRNRS